MAQVIFKRKTTEEIKNLPIDDGQLIYDIITGQTYMDISGKRIKVGNIDISALNVTFEDGETFQEKYNKGELKGQTGPQGAPGIKGEQGIPGSKGDVGSQGPQGDPGPQGDKGDQGIPGPKGDKGDQGIPGPKGDPGLPGKNGSDGLPGETGPQGIPGEKGDPGQNGVDGKTPVKGVDYFTTLEKQEIAKEASDLIPISDYEEKPAVLDIPAESFELAHNTIYRKAEAIGQIIITLPALPNPEFICEIDFTASEAWIAFTAPASIKWLGDGIIDGAFVPAKGKRYSLIFYYDGVHFRAVSQEV